MRCLAFTKLNPYSLKGIAAPLVYLSSNRPPRTRWPMMNRPRPTATWSRALTLRRTACP